MRAVIALAVRGVLFVLGACLPHGGGARRPSGQGRPLPRVVAGTPAGYVVEPGAHGRGKLAPPPGRSLLIIGEDAPAIDAYSETVGRDFAGVMTYLSARELGQLGEFQGILRRYPKAVFRVDLNIAGDLEAVNRGERDANLKEIGRVFQAGSRPVYLRLGFEFDDPGSHYDPDAYVDAFRRIHDRLSEVRVENVADVWHSYGIGVTGRIWRWHPVDDYVDGFGVSCFGDDPASMDAMADFARGRRKSLMIAEATPRRIGATRGEESWRRWFAPCFEFIAKNDVLAFCYTNRDCESIPMFRGQGWGEARVQMNDHLKSEWLAETRKPRYLVAGPSLDRLLGHAP